MAAKSPSVIDINNRMIVLENELKKLKAEFANSLKLPTRKLREIPYSLEQLCKYLKNGDMPEPLVIGDYINFELITGEPVSAYVCGINHDKVINGNDINYTFAFTPIDGWYDLNTNSDNSTGWKNSKGRIYAARVFKLLPNCLQECIKTARKYTSAGNKSSKIIETEDKLFLFSEVEIFGKTPYSFIGEGGQYEFFKSKENLAKLIKRYCWLRSPYAESSDSFCFVACGGSADWDGADCGCGLLFGFCV